MCTNFKIGKQVVSPVIGKGVITDINQNYIFVMYCICKKKSVIKYCKDDAKHLLLPEANWNATERKINDECDSQFKPGHLLILNKIIDKIIDNQESENYYLIKDMKEVVLKYKNELGLNYKVENEFQKINNKLRGILCFKKEERIEKKIDVIIPNVTNCTPSVIHNTKLKEIHFDIQKAERHRIEQIIKRRGIKNLIHFTRVENLPSIIKYGIMSINDARKNNIIFVGNDYERHDDNIEFSSFSVSFPNYKLFNSLSNKNREKWCVIEVSSSILLSNNNLALFYDDNAARYEFRYTPIENLCTAQSFEDMFSDSYIPPDIPIFRSNLDILIPEWYPTNPQAEIMISGIVDLNYINKIYFNNDSSLSRFKESYKGEFNKFSKGIYFGPRDDWEFWRKSNG